MRVALYENLPSGGAKREAYALSSELLKHGNVVDLWTTSAANHAFLPMHEVTIEQFEYRWPYRNVLAQRGLGINEQLQMIRLYADLRRVRQVAHQMAADIDARNYDVVFAHACHPIQAPYLLRYLRTPSIYFCHETMRALYDPPLGLRGGSWLQAPRCGLSPLIAQSGRLVWDTLKKRNEETNVSQATGLLTNSYFSAESIYRAYHRHAYVCYLGVDVSLFRPLQLPRQDFVLSVGEVRAHKGYDFLIHALSIVDMDTRPRLVIVGNDSDPAERRQILALAHRCRVDVEIRSGVPDCEVVELLNRARLFVYSPVLEPFGLAPLEAMACGTPVVAVAEGGVRETVQDGITGILTQRDPRDFATAIVSLWNDPLRRERMGASGIKQVQLHWTWTASYERLIRLISMILEPGSRTYLSTGRA